MDKFTENGLRFDYYGALLTKRQQEVMTLYYEDNLSLSEIAEEFGISRQGVHDTLHAAEKALAEYEEKLGLVAKAEAREVAAAKLTKTLEELVGGALTEGAMAAIERMKE